MITSLLPLKAYPRCAKRLIELNLNKEIQTGPFILHTRKTLSDLTGKQILERISRSSDHDKQEIDYLKKENNKEIFKVIVDNRKFVIKKFIFTSLMRNINYKNYAYAEATNLLLASKLGLSVPIVYGLVSRTKGFSGTWGAVVMEFIDHKSMRDVFLENPTNTELLIANIYRTIPLFAKMHHLGIHHVDFGPHAILLDDKHDDYCIDFQYASFYPEPVEENTIHQAGYLAWSVSTNRKWIPKEDIWLWYLDLMHELNIKRTLKNDKIFINALEQRLPLKKRMVGFGSRLKRL